MSTLSPRISPQRSATFTEFILLPRRTRPEHALGEVSLKTKIARDFPLGIPFLSAAMESVTGPNLAIALSLQGGLGVLPTSRFTIEEQVQMLKLVKGHFPGKSRDYQAIGADAIVAELDRRLSASDCQCFCVENSSGQLVGAMNGRDYNPLDDLGLKVKERMRPLESLVRFSDPEQGKKELLESNQEWAFQVDKDSRLLAVMTRVGLLNELRCSQALRDAQGRPKVAGAVSTHPEDRERARQLVGAGADLLSVDASDGFSDYMKETLEETAALGVPIVAGNVVCREGFRFLAECGAAAVKVGIGSGSICTTRRVKAIGRGQATALMEVVAARDEWTKQTGDYLPVITDGGVSGTGDMSIALAMGADALMMGRYFAGFSESPTAAYKKQLAVMPGTGLSQVAVDVKPYWGEASARAKNVRRYQQNDPRTFVIEGEEGFILHKGSLHSVLPRDLKAICGTLSSCACQNLQEFRQNVVFERQSVGSQAEGGTSIFQG